MDLIWLVLAAAVIAVAVAWGLTKRPRLQVRGKASHDALDTVTGWPPAPTRILTSQERMAYQVLAKALPEYVILAQVPLSRFLKVPTRNSYTEWLSRVGQVSADLVVCDGSTQVIAVVDIRQPPHLASERNRKRHERMRRVLQAAGVPLHIWIENALPTPEAAREALLPAPEGAATHSPSIPHTVPAAKLASAPPVLEDETHSGEEVPDYGEPPPSTWFDNLDSRPAPLQPSSPAPSAPRPPGPPRR